MKHDSSERVRVFREIWFLQGFRVKGVGFRETWFLEGFRV